MTTTVIRYYYKNRRLYDVSRSKYVNHSHLVSIIKSGETLRIEDPQEKDITVPILIGALALRCRTENLISSDVAHSLIRTITEQPQTSQE